jgi:hypothetical protein
VIRPSGRSPCGRCGEHHQTVANWPDGGVCGYCYQQAKRTRGTCACGHDGVLPGRIDGQPACRRCSGVKLNVDCKTCGVEDELYRGNRCWSCEVAILVDRLLTNPDTGVMAAEMVPVAAALKSMKRSNSGVTWIRQRHVSAFLKDLAVAPTITHEKLDNLPGADRTRNSSEACWSSTAPCRHATSSPSSTTNGPPVHSSASAATTTATSYAGTSAGI